jgi:hypothetical protein
MTQSTDFSPEDGAEFASLMGINEENDQSEVDEPSASETDDEDVDAPDSDDEPDNSEEEEEAPQKSTETPKKKS